MGKVCTSNNTIESHQHYQKKVQRTPWPYDSDKNMKPKTKQAIKQFFPGAMTGPESEQKVYSVLKSLGFKKDNTLFADSSCPDEINHNDPDEDVTGLFTQRWGSVFPLSGLGGMPFAGKTGWHAFSSHCPDDGNIVVLIGPHVGVDTQGNVGKIERCGQANISSACGAAIGALGALEADMANKEMGAGLDDFQMDAIKHLLAPHVEQLQEVDNKQAALAYKMFDIEVEQLEKILHLNWMGPNSKLAIFGGIMINVEGEKTDRFLPLKFEVRDKRGSIDCYEETFGKSKRKYNF